MSSSDKSDSALRRIARAARWTALRLRLDAALSRFVLLLLVPLLYAVGALTAIKVWRPGAHVEQTLLYVGIVPLLVPFAGALVAWFAARPRHVGAMALDRHHGLADRLTSALSFREKPEAERTPLMQAAIEDALAAARDLKPRRAAPFHMPRELPIAGFLLVSLVGIALLEVRTERELPPPRTFTPLVMTADDVELFKDMAKEMQDKAKDPEVQAAVRRFNQLVEDIAQRRLDRTEVFKRLEELDRELMKGAEADREALKEGLEGLAKELEKSELAKPVAEPLAQKKLPDAEKALRELAKSLRDKKNPPSKAQLEKLRQALKKASKSASDRQKRLDEQRKKLAEERDRLLKKKKEKDGGLSKQEERLLQKKERQLERLDRERDRAQRASRQLSRLDRELAKAAEDLMKEMGLSADDLEKAAEDLNRMAKQEMTEQEKEELRRRLQELRELVRQQGKGGKERLQRLLKFGRQARGQKGGGQQGKGQGQQQGQGMKPGKGGDTLVMGPGAGGQTIPIPGMGAGQGAGEMPGQGQQGSGKGGDKPGGGGGKGGDSWGSGHDANLQGDKSEIKGQTKDVTAVAADTGEGTASSQVIYGAAERGFTGRGYKKVYTDYKTVAEQVMNDDEIPPGYRFYVQRYFQLIRPRE